MIPTDLTIGIASIEGIIGTMIPVVIFMIPIVAILTKHQQRMAEIIHNANGQRTHVDHDIASLQQEMRELKQLVHQQTIVIDNIASQTRTTPPAVENIQDRLTN